MMTSAGRRAAPLKQQGIGIIEVLVALVVVSFGVLGMAGLQLTGMKQSTNSFNRSKALMLTENMATRMRINRPGVVNLAYAGFDSGANADYCQARPVPYCQATSSAPAQSCTVDELAAFDLFSVSCGDWGSAGANDGVQGLLPEGARLQVICNDAPCAVDSTYTLSVSWPENRTASSGEAPEIRQVQMRLRP
ncbi:MAG: type IV pilus modification protein PilV [Granulosicoccus sp.]|nr:type IV pilus modification protein PilV [Granulosicoccus sp.]